MSDESSSEHNPHSSDSEGETEIEIPRLFYSEETDLPFERCIDCDRALLSPTDDLGFVSYQVSKVFVRNEAVFEFAMCADCQGRLHQEFSEETCEAIIQFCRENMMGIFQSQHDSFQETIAACVVCDRAREDCHRYSLGGLFSGMSLQLTPWPHIICDECESQVGELISQKTRDAWDRFVEEHFDSPPGMEIDDWSKMPMLI
jgi:hypothetical protein